VREVVFPVAGEQTLRDLVKEWKATGPTYRIDFVPILFISLSIWRTADYLRLTVLKGLRKGLKLCHEMRRAHIEDEQHKVAGAIVEHLESTFILAWISTEASRPNGER
jgi:hypothetical protein